MSAPSFREIQFRFARHLRDPARNPPPADVEDRRLAIYRDLIYRNIEGFLANGFPVLRKITDDGHWHALVRDFIANHRCRSPYFLEIGQEFLHYLQEIRCPQGWEPPFLPELCHYEWVELALDTAEEEIPPAGSPGDPLGAVFQVSPLVWRLAYRYPVHRISPGFQPQEPVAGGVHLLVYRNRADEVKFLEVNPVVSRLVQLMENSHSPLRALLTELAGEACYSDLDAFFAFAVPAVRQLEEQSVLVPLAPAPD